MSISKQEAERCYPTQYWNGKNWPLKLLPLTTDEEEDEDHWSYISGNRRDDLMAIAKKLLDAARKAVM